jgi:riboflavin kinase/FMN adenylyltransferase
MEEGKSNGVWLTIGTFDGVHLGHQHIIRDLVSGAHNENKLALVVTFYPNPAVVLSNIEKPNYLTSPREKSSYLRALGVDSVLTVKFDNELSKKSAEEFMLLLDKQLKISCLLIGHDFRLGANREGDLIRLTEIGRNLGYRVQQVKPLEMDESPISSTRIRESINIGDVYTAAKYLGRYYKLRGKVIHGDGRGKHIGLPTANMKPLGIKLIPSQGIYSAYVKTRGKVFQSVISIGSRPTFYDPPANQTIEVHILDFSSDLYGEDLTIFFVDCIRPERKFDSIDALMDVIKNDIEHARKVLSDEATKKYLPA